MTVRCSLVVARDPGLAWALVRLLARHGLPAFEAGDDLRCALTERVPYPVVGVLVDARLLGDDPAGAVAAVRSAYDEAVVVVMSAGPDHPALPQAVRAGAVPLTASFRETDLVDLLSEAGGGEAGVREPRRPGPHGGGLAAAAALPPP